jgi:flagellar motor switch protein FliG
MGDIVSALSLLKDFSDEEIEKIMDKASKIKAKKKRKSNLKPIKNKFEEDFTKGNARNMPCPKCGKKMKKCECWDI